MCECHTRFFKTCNFFFPRIGHYSAKNHPNLLLTVEIWTYFIADTFINVQFFAKIMLFRPHSQLIVKMWTFLGTDTFINVQFCINTLSFCRKSVKFATNCQNVNFSWGWYFYKCTFFLHKYSVILPKSAKLATKSISKSFKKF